MSITNTKTTNSTPAPAKPRAKLAATDLIRAMWTGDPGKGKTFDMMHMAKGGHIIAIDAERRIKPSVLKRAGIPTDNVEPRLCTEAEPLTYDSLLALAIELQERIANGEPLHGLVWDSASESSRLLLGNLVDKAVSRANAKGQERDQWKTFQEDYGDLTEQMRRVIRRFRDLPIHLAISTWSDRRNDEEGAVRVSPALTPAVLRDYLGYMDIVIHKRVELVEDVEEYSGLTKPTGRFEAKDAYGVLPRILVNPTFERVLAYVNGDLTSANDPVQIKAKEARTRVASSTKVPAPATA